MLPCCHAGLLTSRPAACVLYYSHSVLSTQYSKYCEACAILQPLSASNTVLICGERSEGKSRPPNHSPSQELIHHRTDYSRSVNKYYGSFSVDGPMHVDDFIFGVEP